MEEIREAIERGARAGKLRRYVRENGDGLAGLLRLADHESAASSAALNRLAAPCAAAEVGGTPGG